MAKTSKHFSVNNRSNIVKEASKFESYADFIKNGKEAYEAAQYYDCIEDIKNMFNNKKEKQMANKNVTKDGAVDKRIKWVSAKQVMKAVRECKTSTEWQKKYWSAVERFKLIDDAKQVFKDRKNPSKTKEEVMAEAAKYTNRQDMLAHSTTAYRIAINNGWDLTFKSNTASNVVETTKIAKKPAKTQPKKSETTKTSTNNVELNMDDLFKILTNDKFSNEQKNIALKLLANA